MGNDGSSPDDLTGRVATWLEKQGYPLEMRAAQEFRNAEFTVVQSSSYADEDTGKYRELDLVAFRDKPRRGFRVVVVAECKAGAGKPWVVFSDGRSISPTTLAAHQIVATRFKSEWLRLTDEPTSDLALLRETPRTGYNATQAFTEREDAVHAAVTGSVKAALALRDNIDRFNERTLEIRAILVPVVIIDAPLFECYLDEAGKTTLEPVERIRLTFRKPGLVYFVNVVRIDVLSDFTRDCSATLEALDALRVGIA